MIWLALLIGAAIGALFLWFSSSPNTAKGFALNTCLGAGGAGVGMWGAEIAGLFSMDQLGTLIAAPTGAVVMMLLLRLEARW